MAGVQRWRFRDETVDPAVEYTVPVNPNQMSSPFSERSVTVATTTAVDGQPLVTEGQRQPKEWTFSGVILDEGHLESLREWANRPAVIYIYDHYRRRFTTLLKGFDVVPGRRSVQFPYHHTYTMNALVFEYARETAEGSGVWLPVTT